MASWNPNLSDDEEDEDVFRYGGRNAVIFLIDVNSTMFESEENNSSNFLKCLRCIEAMMLNKAIENDKDLLSIVLYNTVNTPDPKVDDIEDYKYIVVPKQCAILLLLKPMFKEKIKFVKSLIESEDHLDFFNVYGHSSDTKISDVMWLCSAMFAQCGYKLQDSSIFHFTNIDIPHPIGSSEYQQSMVKAKDLKQLNLDYRLFPMKENFQDSFYRDFICTMLDLDPDEFIMPAFENEEMLLLRRVFKKDFKKRAIAHLKFSLRDKLCFGVEVFTLTRKTFLPKKTWLSRSDFEKIEVKSRWKYAVVGDISDEASIGQSTTDGASSTTTNEEPGAERSIPTPGGESIEFKEYLTPKLTVKCLNIGQEEVCFTPLEVFQMKQIMDSGIKLLGFKPISSIDQKLFYKRPYFLYPSDARIEGSTKLFRAIWEKCLEKEKAVICVCTLKKKSAPRIVALIPTKEEETPDGDILRYDGFRMMPLPYAEDIRDLKNVLEREDVVDEDELEEGIEPEVEEAVCASFEGIVKKLTFKNGFKPTLFENPILRTAYANIEATALEKEVEEIEDTSLPDIERQDRKVGPYLETLTEIFGDLSIDRSCAPSKMKRKLPKTDKGGNAPKVPREEVSPEFILNAIKTNNLKSVTVPQLKSYVSSQLGISGVSKMNKDNCIQLIKSYHEI